MSLRSFSLLAWVAAVFAGGANAQDFQVEAGISSLGYYVAPSTQLGPKYRLRIPIYLASFDGQSQEFEGNSVQASIDVRSGAVVADYALGQAGFRLTGGLALGGYKITSETVNPTLDGTTFAGTFGLTIEQRNQLAPQLAVGFARPFGKQSRLGFAAEVGLRIASLQVSTTGQELLPQAERDDFNAEIVRINDELNDVPLLPFFAIGLSYQF